MNPPQTDRTTRRQSQIPRNPRDIRPSWRQDLSQEARALFPSPPHVESMTDDSQEDEDIIISRGTQAQDETQMETQSSERSEMGLLPLLCGGWRERLKNVLKI
jgi:hypothetical protein